MTIRTVKKLDQCIEAELASHVARLLSCNCSRVLFGEYIEMLYLQVGFGIGDLHSAALEIVGAKLPISCSSPALDNIPEVLRDASTFGAAYHMVRDFIYYYYSNPDSIALEELESKISITVKDRSILRQIVHQRQLFAMNSVKTFRGDLEGLDASVLRGTKHWDTDNPKVAELLALIEKEVEVKIDTYFSYLPDNCAIEMGGFQYRELLEVYRHLLFLGLYERRFAGENRLPSVVSYKHDELCDGVSRQTGFDFEKCHSILVRIAVASRQSFIWDEDERVFHLLPCTFTLRDGLGAALRHYAAENSARFSADFAGPLGSALVARIDSHFRAFENFRTRTEVVLQAFGTDLPDIDCLALSYEPSLGFHAYICEVKNNLPANWAKDYLKGAGSKGYLEKALQQIEKVKLFLSSEDGAQFLRMTAVDLFSHLAIDRLFPTGFVLLVEYIIVTSQNIGVSFPDEKTVIVDADLLQHIIEQSDGDINYMQSTLRQWHATVDESYKLSKMNTEAMGRTIEFDVAEFRNLIRLTPNAYISDGTFRSIEAHSLESGYRYIDTLERPK
jgi:hypothetical protein